MIVELRLDGDRRRAWMLRLVRALAADGMTIQVRWQTGAAKPAGLDSLLSLERSLLRRSRPCGSDPLPDGALDDFAAGSNTPDVIVDLSSVPTRLDKTAGRSLQIYFEGGSGENAALDAILRGDMPQIEICDAASGVIIERGKPSAEIAVGLGGAFDAVMARVSTLLRATLSGRPRVIPPSFPGIAKRAPRSPAAFVTANLGVSIIKAIYRLCCQTPNWRVGWRHTDKGVADRQNLAGESWNVLANDMNRVFADPFAVTWQGRHFLFAEDIDARLGRGVISAVEFDNRGPKGPMTPVLQEPWHLSYPFLIEHGGELWMIPESSSNGDVAIYRAARFPDRWERHATLISGVEAADATVTKYNGRFYMFAVTRDGDGGYSDTLSIFHAPDLFGPWEPHAANPIFVDRARARPAGAFFEHGSRLWRPVQDCTHGYGSALALAEVTALSPETFAQDIRSVIHPGAAWPGRKIHTLNRSGTLEVIDGASSWPKLKMPRFSQARIVSPPVTPAFRSQ